MRLAVTQTPVKYHSTNTDVKHCRGVNNNNKKSLLIAAKSNSITTISKEKLDKTQKQSGCRFHGDRDEIISYTITECSKCAQKIV